MKKIIVNICILMVTTLVLFLSVGIHISKMKCSEDNRFFIGTAVPNCMQERDIACVLDSQKTSCCQKDTIEETCCPETNDDTCASEKTNIQFDFETLIPFFNHDFELLSVVTCVLIYKKSYYTIGADYVINIPPPRINKPELIDIQSFLL